MKVNDAIWRLMLICITAMMCVGISGCSDSDEPDTSTPDTPSKTKGDVEFSINLPSGSGAATATSPAVVNKGDTLSLTISQKSSYTDPDGSVFSCEPKAAISLFAKVDTVYAKDLAALTQVKGTDVKINRTGSSPVVNQTVQTFEIGGQSVVFDLSHEVYTYINSEQESVEMPYVRLNQAKIGNKAATEEKPQGRSAIAVTGITVRPLAPSRAIMVTDTTMYEVNVRFSLEIESVNTSKTDKQALEFSLNYVGGVETVTELKEPVSELAYEWSVKSGTSNTVPPFVTNAKEMEVWMVQNSSYTDEYGNTATASPTAKIKLNAKHTTVWVSSKDELSALPDITGETDFGQSAIQRFGSDAQEIAIEWSYESVEASIAGKTIEMPYYALEPARLKDVDVKELRDDKIDGKECTLYEVTATFTQKAVSNNVSGDSSEVEIEYSVKYFGALEIKIVMVEYFPGGEWIDPHDNMKLAYYAHVHRYRTYSNGKRVGPDVFGDYGHFIQLGFAHIDIDGFNDLGGGDWIDGGPEQRTTIGDSIATKTKSHKLSRLYGLSNPEIRRFGFLREHFGDWDKYIPSNDYRDESFNLCKGVYCPDEWPEDSRPNGWYFLEFFYEHYSGFKIKLYEDMDLEDQIGLSCGICFYMHDQFLVIDGRRIDFSRLRNLKMDFKHTVDRFSEPGKEGVISKKEMDATYLGKKFYEAQIDTFYVAK